MGIEPKRRALQSLENAAFCETPVAAGDWRANFYVLRGNVGLRETTACGDELIARVPALSPPPHHAAIRQADDRPSGSAAAYPE
jgi:hypothetical protein